MEFQGNLKKVSSVFQENFNKKFQGCFKNVSMKVCSRMDFLAATRAEGGLVFIYLLYKEKRKKHAIE